MYDVLIIGGGAAGYGCALTLASVEDKFDWAKDRKYLMIDDGNSDILKASFYNVPGIALGIGGDDLYAYMQKQLTNFKSCEVINDTVTKLERISDGFEVTINNKTYSSIIVVLATGMHNFDIECDFVSIISHNDVMKPNKICVKNYNLEVADGLYVAGLASGAKTMFAIASGEGTKVACDIFKLWTKKSAVAHASIKDKISFNSK
jgi:thioredoxin reductase